MRLIDADVLIKTLNKDIESLKYKPDGLDKTIAIKAAEFFIQDIQDVNTTPTAYDIDKVVEDLLQCTYCNGHKDHEKQCGGCAGCLECKLEDAYYKAIEIVKRGGKDV